MSDSVERRLRTLETQVPRWKEPWRRGHQHHYQSMIPSTPDTFSFASLHSVENTPILCPLHLERPMHARAVYYVVKGTSEPVTRIRVATAIYRARAPIRGTKSEMVASPLEGVTFHLVRALGQTNTVGTGDPELHRVTVSAEAPDVELDPELPHFLAFMLDDPSSEMYAPVSPNFGTSAIVSATQAERFAAWPEELTADRSMRARIPYFVLRSAMGVVLYGDPEET